MKVASTLLTKGIPNKYDAYMKYSVVVSTLLTKGIPNYSGSSWY